MAKYGSMRELYAGLNDVECITYGKGWRRHEWSQMVEELATDNAETQRSSRPSIGVALRLARARPPKFRLLSRVLREAMRKADVESGDRPAPSSCGS